MNRNDKLIFVFIVLVIVLAACGSVADKYMPGEYVIGEDGNGPIDVFYAGTIEAMNLYRMQDVEAGTRCYIMASERYDVPAAIACLIDSTVRHEN